MKKHFYSHIIETTEISLALGDLNLSQEERVHLIQLVEKNLHHEILDLVLSELSEEDKKTFLHHVAHEKHDKVWEHLTSKIENVEEKIKKVAHDLTKELHHDITHAQKRGS